MTKLNKAIKKALMRSQQSRSPIVTRKRHNVDNRRRKMILKQKKGDQHKSWNFQRILGQRIRLSQQLNVAKGKQKRQIVNSDILALQKNKQYLIQWSQQSQKGIWSNTWQPQNCIPESSRLDYLLSKRNQLRKSKKNKKRILPLTQTANKINTQTNRKQKQQSIQKVKKMLDKDKKYVENKINRPNYKSWCKSYSDRVKEFKKIIQRFLKGQKNQGLWKKQIKQKNCSNLKNKKYSNVKMQFLNSTQSNEKSFQYLDFQRKLQSAVILQQNHTENFDSYMSKIACQKFIKDVDFHVHLNQIDYFKLKLYDDSVCYISEQDLVKYLPFAYQKLMLKKIDHSIKQGITSLQKIQIFGKQKNSHCNNYTKHLCSNLGITDELITNLNAQTSFSQNGKKGAQINCFQQMQFIFSNKQFGISDISGTLDKNNIISQQEKTQKQVNKPQIYDKIDKYFDHLKSNAEQTEIILCEDRQQSEPINYDRYKKPNNLQFLTCRQMFNCLSNANLYGQTANKKQVNKVKQNNNIQIKVTKQRKVYKQYLKQIKISIKKEPTKIDKQDEQLKNSDTLNSKGQGSHIETFKLKLKKEHNSIKQKIQPFVNIQSSQKQFSQLLNILSEPNKQQQDVYDSADQESSK